MRDVERRGTAFQRGYDGAWVAVRNAYAREHPLCEDCLEHGIVTALELVDHVIPLPHGPRLDKSNLRSLCRPHHATKTERDRVAGYTANVTPTLLPEQRRWIVA